MATDLKKETSKVRLKINTNKTKVLDVSSHSSYLLQRRICIYQSLVSADDRPKLDITRCISSISTTSAVAGFVILTTKSTIRFFFKKKAASPATKRVVKSTCLVSIAPLSYIHSQIPRRLFNVFCVCVNWRKPSLLEKLCTLPKINGSWTKEERPFHANLFCPLSMKRIQKSFKCFK